MTWVLRAHDQHAAIADSGAVTLYADRGVPTLAGAERPELFAFRSSLLAPWPNRVVGGRWAWEGVDLELPVNDAAAGAALHGLVFSADWRAEQADDARMVLTLDLPPVAGYPFPLALTATYELTERGLVCALTARNTGDRKAPVGLGVHPYIDALGLVDELHLLVPATTLLQTDDSWGETGRIPVDGAGLDFRTPARVGPREIDAAFTGVITDADGRSVATVRRPDGSEVLLWSGPTCRWWVVYSGHTLPEPDRRRSIAVEPMTCPPDAFNTGEIDVLQPGETLTLDWGFSLR